MSEINVIAEEKKKFPQDKKEVFEISQEHCSFLIEKQPFCIVKCTAKIDAEMAENFYHRALKEVNKNVTLSGFRKGKIPLKILEKNYAPSIDHTWKRIMKKELVLKATELSRLECYRFIDSQFTLCSIQQGATLSFSFEFKPIVPLIDPSRILLKKEFPQKVTEEAVQKKIQLLLEEISSWKEEESRPIQEGDYVQLEFLSPVEEQWPILKKKQFSIKRDRIPVWIYENILGKKPEEEVECKNIESTVSQEEKIPEEKRAENAPSTSDEITYRFRIKNIVSMKRDGDQKLLELYKQNSLEDVKKIIHQQMEEEKKEEVKVKQAHESIKQIKSLYNIDLPTSFMTKIDAECKRMSADEKNRMKKEVIENSHIQLLLNKYIQDHKITVSKELIHKHVYEKHLSEILREKKENLKTTLNDYYSESASYLLNAKALIHIVERASFQE